MSVTNTIERQVERVLAEIANARKRVGEGKSVDLSAFEADVRTLVEAVKREPPTDWDGFEARVRAVFDNLDNLDREMTAAKEVVDARLADMQLATSVSADAWKAR